MKHIRNINRQTMMLPAAVVIIVCILCMSGIFPYSRSGETAINQLTVADGSVTIQEPAWDAEGQSMAEHTEPGMLIPKNPSGINNGNADLYIRLKMTVTLGAFDGTGKTQTYIDTYKDNYSPDTDGKNAERSERRFQLILQALTLENGDSLFNADISQCNNSYFSFEEDLNQKTGTQRVFYFYYKEENSENMRIVSPDTETEELFSSVKIPVYKKDYLGVFDQKYSITLSAEGIPAMSSQPLTVTEAKSRF